MKQTQQLHRVSGIRQLTDSSYVLRVEWDGGIVQPGQRFALGIPGINERRWYSLYSRPNCEELEFLIREVSDGLLSRAFKRARKGDLLEVQGPAGHFTIDATNLDETTYLFIATGTGIAPFHAIIQAYPDMNYILLHGIRYLEERYDYQHYHPERYISCVSRQHGGDYFGRVTDYIAELDVPPTHKVYLCGNQQMIYQVYYDLLSREHPRDGLQSEVYF